MSAIIKGLNAQRWIEWAKENGLDFATASLNPLDWFSWLVNRPWLILVILTLVAVIVAWRFFGDQRRRRMIIRTAVSIVGVGAIIFGAQWFADWVRPSLQSADLYTPPVVGPQAVKVVMAEQKPIELRATYTGSVGPFEDVILRSRVDGFVEEVLVYPGDYVKKGQVVLRLETSELTPQLRKAEADRLYFKAEFERDEYLFEEGAISESAYELSKNRADVAAANLKLLQTKIDYATVKALSDGQVSRRVVDPGQYVNKGDHLIAYDRLDEIRVRFDVAVADLSDVAVGTDIDLEFPEISPDALSGGEVTDQITDEYGAAAIRAKVTSVFPRVDEVSRLGIVEAVIRNPGGLIKSNTYSIGHLLTGKAENAWVVPERALVSQPGGKTVIFVAPAFADQGATEMREVVVGLRNGKEAQILEGLTEPTYVVTAGNRNLVDGETVAVIERKNPMLAQGVTQ